jgi:hypothetical protein
MRKPLTETTDCPGCGRKIAVPEQPNAENALSSPQWCQRCGGTAPYAKEVR